jgi:hypothetical protein
MSDRATTKPGDLKSFFNQTRDRFSTFKMNFKKDTDVKKTSGSDQ